jgi:hypothetical protein
VGEEGEVVSTLTPLPLLDPEYRELPMTLLSLSISLPPSLEAVAARNLLPSSADPMMSTTRWGGLDEREGRTPA